MVLIYPVFLRNISKKKTKKFQNIFKKKKYFVAYDQILKFFSSIFFIKKKNKTKIASFSCFEISKKK